MGTWGPGLYSNDIAKDLKSTISAVAQLPLGTSDLVDIIVNSFPEAANDSSDEDHTTFWLVLADQFHRKGIASRDVFERGLDIIDSGKDLNSPSVTDMGPADQRKREKALNELRDQLIKPLPAKNRKTLLEPQQLILDVGDVLIFPIVETGGCYNPYMTKAGWTHADWGAAAIIRRGLAFGYLAHYTPVVINQRLNVEDKPNLEYLMANSGWRLGRPGTCSKPHYKRMQLEKVGMIDIAPRRIMNIFPDIADGTYFAVNDISIANSLYVFKECRDHDQNVRSLSDLTVPS